MSDAKTEVIIWDAGEDKGIERYTVLAGNKVMVVGMDSETPLAIDIAKNIEVFSVIDIDKEDMDFRCKRINITDLPKVIIDALKRRI